LLVFVQLGGPRRPEFGALGWSCVVVEMLCVGLILFVFVFFSVFPSNKIYSKNLSSCSKKSNCEVHCHLEPRCQVSLTSRQGSPNRWEPDRFSWFPVEPGRPGTRTGPVPTHKPCLSFSNPTEPAGFTGLPAGFFIRGNRCSPRGTLPRANGARLLVVATSESEDVFTRVGSTVGS
jgi:hypothetical protein